MGNGTTKSEGNEERKVWKKKDDMECSIALCATKKQNLWHVDNGCSKHMTGDPNKFISLKRSQKGKVTFGNNLTSKIIGKGAVVLRDKMKVGQIMFQADINNSFWEIGMPVTIFDIK